MTNGLPRWVRRWAPLWCALIFVGLQMVAFKQEPPFGDSYQYGVKTLEILGASPQEAHQQMLRVACERDATLTDRYHNLNPVQRFAFPPPHGEDVQRCLDQHAAETPPTSPRLRAIFDSRPGFPLLVAPFAAVLGIDKGLLVASWLIGAAGGLMVFLLLRLAGAAKGAALLGQVLFYGLPIGYWAARTLADGSMILATVGALIGALLLLQRRMALGLTVLLGAQLAGLLTKYSQVSILGITLTAAAAGVWLLDRQRRHLGTALLAAGATFTLAVGIIVPHLLGWPGLDESLQDTFTDHFQSGPDVPDPLRRLGALNLAYWTQWLQEQAQRPLLLIATIAGALMLWRWQRSFALVVLAAGATGIATEIAHPMWIEVDRLYTQVWLVAVVGLALLWRSSPTSAAAPSTPALPRQRESRESESLDVLPSS